MFQDRPVTFFQRNHQKVMLVDDNIFCGSLNLANHYTSVRYGDGSFRDLNIILKGHPAKKVRDFFKDIILSNQRFYKEIIDKDKINAIFEEMDVKYAWQEAEIAFPHGWPEPAEHSVNTNVEIKDEINKAGTHASSKIEEEVSVFLEETPPNKTEVSRAVLEMIKRAKHKI